MKYIIFLAALVLCQQVYGQKAPKPFEGSIRYKIRTPDEPKDLNLEVFFGSRKLRVNVPAEWEGGLDKKGALANYVILDLDSAISYRVNPNTRTFEFTRLIPSDTVLKIYPKNRKTLRYQTTLVDLRNRSSSPELARILSIDGVVVYTGDELYFPMPNHVPLGFYSLLVQNNRIVLYGEMNFEMPQNRRNLEADIQVIYLEAQTVKSQKLDKSVFSIPKEYTEMEEVNIRSDTVTVEDTIYSNPVDTSYIDTVYSTGIGIDTIYSTTDTQITDTSNLRASPEEKAVPVSKPPSKKKKKSSRKESARKPD